MKKTLGLFVLAFTLSFLMSCPTPSSPSNKKVISVTVTPKNGQTVDKGGTKEFTALVIVQGGASAAVTWDVTADPSGILAAGTKIDSNGKLTVAADETAVKLKVTATSTVDKSKKGSATVNVTSVDNPPKVNSVTVDPKGVTVNRGETKEFTATVAVEGNAPVSVTWDLSGNTKNGTIIAPLENDSNKATLTVAVDETANALTIKAKSTYDNTKTDSVTITVLDPGNPNNPQVTGVTVNAEGGVTEVLRSKTLRFTASVTAAGGASTEVDWSITTTGKHVDTIIAGGVLTVAAYEPLNALTIKAASKHSPNVFDEKTVSVRYNKMYIIGDDFGGWSPDAAPGSATGIEMVKSTDGVYTWTGKMTKDKTFKFHDDLIQNWDTGNWFVPMENNRGATGTVDVVLEKVSGSNAFLVTSASGRYTITLNTLVKKATFAASQADIGDVTINWSIADEGDSLTLTGNTPFLVCKTGGIASVTVSLSTAGYTCKWYVDGVQKGTSGDIAINATDYALGGHELLLVATNNSNVSWTAPSVKFTVTKQ
ncbi:MAG: hypothetical protein LBD18_02335 [Treponema sp.]|jgi:hypothetical protein|nr:hypothetical protein [Treponema sp.]